MRPNVISHNPLYETRFCVFAKSSRRLTVRSVLSPGDFFCVLLTITQRPCSG
jgi:hypothetical protein